MPLQLNHVGKMVRALNAAQNYTHGVWGSRSVTELPVCRELHFPADVPGVYP